LEKGNLTTPPAADKKEEEKVLKEARADKALTANPKK
jgi:hypothetical protein